MGLGIFDLPLLPQRDNPITYNYIRYYMRILKNLESIVLLNLMLQERLLSYLQLLVFQLAF